MPSNGFSRRHFGKIAGWTALGLSTVSAKAADAGKAQRDSPAGQNALPAFPSDFRRGTAPSAFQIEGAVNDDGRGPSICYRFTQLPGKRADLSNADGADPHSHRY